MNNAILLGKLMTFIGIKLSVFFSRPNFKIATTWGRFQFPLRDIGTSCESHNYYHNYMI